MRLAQEKELGNIENAQKL